MSGTSRETPAKMALKNRPRLLLLVVIMSASLFLVLFYVVNTEENGLSLYVAQMRTVTLPNLRPLGMSNVTARADNSSISPQTQRTAVVPKFQLSTRRLNNIPLPAPPVVNKLTKVLVMAYFRSGSTYFSEMFNFNPGAFYMFEPLIYFLEPPNGTIRLLNGKAMSVATMLRPSYIVQLLDSILNCRLHDIPVLYLKHSFLTKSERFWRYLRCLQPLDNRISHAMTYCIQSLIQMCKTSTLRAVKVIRFSIIQSSLVKLKEKNPELKFIHLVRDPRGVILSQLDAKPAKTPFHTFKRIVGFCNKVRKELEEVEEVNKAGGIELLQVNYEDMAENPGNVVTKVYGFLGLRIPERVLAGIRHRSTGHRHNDKFGTVRENSTFTAYAWKWKITYDVVKTIDSHCSEWYPKLGYLPVKSRKELSDPRIKHRFTKDDTGR